MNQKLLALYGLKWNPFSPELPIDAIHVPPKLENFCWRIEHAQIREGGFARVHGDPGTGKSVALRLLASRLAKLPDVTVGAINLETAVDRFSPQDRPHGFWLLCPRLTTHYPLLTTTTSADFSLRHGRGALAAPLLRRAPTRRDLPG